MKEETPIHEHNYAYEVYTERKDSLTRALAACMD